jgi:ABC-type transport system involved in multi-copper enzyme maturation permease subunit
MFLRIALFEIRFWLRSWMVWIFLFIIGLLVFGAVGTDIVQLGGALSNTYHNAPYVIQNYYSFIGLFTLLMATAFVNSAAIRDFSQNTYQLIFTTPIRKFDFLLGRFIGATLISIIPMLGVSVGILLAKYMPWVDPERWEGVNWIAHLNGIAIFALPNTFFMAAIMFAVAVLARNEIVSFVAALVLLAGYGVAGYVLQDIRHEQIAALLDPFGIGAFGLVTRYWTVAEKNNLSVGFQGLLLWNRLLWIGVGCVIFAFAYARFSFAERSTKARPVEADAEEAIIPVAVALARPQLHDAPWTKFAGSFKIHFLGMARSTFFIVIAVASLLNCIPSLALSATEGYGNQTLPVTYWILDLIRGTLYLFVVIVITYYAGVLIWKDRDERMDEIADSTPAPDWISYASRLLTLMVMVMLMQFAALLGGVAVQTWHGYHRYQFGLYLHELMVRDASAFLFLSVLAFLIHVFSPNKYIGYFFYIAFVAANAFMWGPLNVATHLVQFGSRSNIVYSDMFGEAPYTLAWDWYTFYWAFFCVLLAILTIMFWPRGKQDRWRGRWRNAGLRYHRGWAFATVLGVLAFAATGAWIWYNTAILNRMVGPKTQQRLQADYEKTYKLYQHKLMPRVRDVKYTVDVYPETRNIVMRSEQVIQNPYQQPLDEIHFSVDPNYTTEIDIPGATVTKDDEKLFYRIYKFDPPLQPGESRTMHFTVKSKNRGFENSLSTVELVQNGTFFNNGIGPMIGYDEQRQLGDPNDRKKYGLKQIDLMPALERNCTTDCDNTYIPGNSDWTTEQTVISTSPDQIAIAPGSLVREWQENGRRYFEYKLDHPSIDFYNFMSARYEVKREDWNGIKLEVYYDKQHPWNVPRMMNSLKKSLGYYTQNFGPYYQKEARIIEFPRVATFAQAFPGTMPYSESIGFIANINKPDDIDFVFYVVAHEMGHQWWAHQVIGANMEGATVLSETLAQYSALMVMEKEYGRDMMRKFLKYEMDNYLRSRGAERLKERPLLTVESNQGYIHYRKGSVVLYYLKEMIGEEAVNRALRKVIQQYAYANPPYPTSYALIDALKEQTRPDLQYLIKDLFEDITIFSNRTLNASAQKRSDGKYDVTINVEAQKYKADAKGNETEVPVNDFIDIGAFAKPGKNKQYGDTLYRQRVHITQKDSTFTFVTDSLPDKAGIDPFALLIDRIPDDNTKSVTLVSK